jgi:hypothetical protein
VFCGFSFDRGNQGLVATVNSIEFAYGDSGWAQLAGLLE